MIETYYAGAYWAARRESASDCARRAQTFFHALARDDGFFAQWLIPPRSRKQGPRPLALELSTLEDLFAQNRVHNDEGGIIEDLGFSLSVDNGMRPGKHQGDHSQLRISCGSHAEPITNVCLLSLPSTGPHRERVLTGHTLAAVLRAMALAWEPDWSVATSDTHREMMPKRAAGTFVGWVMYFPRHRGPVPPLPEPVHVDLVEERGTLVTLTPERFTVSNPAHVELAAHVQHVLDRAGLLVPVTPRKPAPAR